MKWIRELVMVDFKKLLKNKPSPKKTNPIEIYNSLDRRSEAGPLRPSQEKILDRWFSQRKEEKDNIIKLHTGEGKTLVGLLILQSKINSSEGPCLYVCPNKYLVEQVRQEALKFGIQVEVSQSSSGLPDDFLSGNKILITHVQKVFNGKTIFGLNNQSIKIGAIIIDDSHACIDSMKQALTIRVKNDNTLYKETLKLFGDDIREQGEGSFLEIESGDYNAMLPIPYWSWYDKREEITRIISNLSQTEEVKFVWSLIKNSIYNCQAFISGHVLEICPSLMPIENFGSFSEAKHRILMSATTQDDSFFIKGLGFNSSSVKMPLTHEEQKWSGEKMILIPSLINESIDRDYVINWFSKIAQKTPFGIVFLTSSFSKNIQYEEVGALVTKSENIYDVVKNLKNGLFTRSVVFVNRYDGIDLPDNSCRILILDSKPFFDSLLDRYEENCRVNSDVINVRVAQKIEQGLGRSVRGEKDYSIIILVGSDLVKFIKSPLTKKYFSSQTRKQIEIGMELANIAKEDADEQKPENVLIELINQVLQRDDGWKEYYSEGMMGIDDDDDIVKEDIYEILQLEYQAERYFAIDKFDKACEIMQQLVDRFTNDKSENGWYLQQLARYNYRFNKSKFNILQRSAFERNQQLLKPKDGIRYTKMEGLNDSRISRIKKWMSQYNNYEDMKISLDDLLQNLSFSMPSEKFESALQQIGESIGFLSQRPDKEIKKGPDNLWGGVENYYFLIECKSEVNDTRKEISKAEAGQMNSHSGWFEIEYGEDVQCKRILIIHTKELSYHANFTHSVEIMRKNGLNKLKGNVKNFFKEFSNYTWLEVTDQKIQELINTYHLDITSFKEIGFYTESYYHKTS